MERTIITKNNVTCVDERKNKRNKINKFLAIACVGGEGEEKRRIII